MALMSRLREIALAVVLASASSAIACTGQGVEITSQSESPMSTPSVLAIKSPPSATPPLSSADLPSTVRRVIEAVANADEAALIDLVQLQPRPCSQTSSPTCRAGDPPGTVYRSFPTAVCEGYWTTNIEEVFRSFPQRVGPLYGVARMGPHPPLFDPPYGSFVVIFEPRDPGRLTAAVALYLSEEGIVRSQMGCRRADQYLQPGTGESPFQILWMRY